MSSDLQYSSSGPALQSSIRGLYATPPGSVSFLKGIELRSFLLEREQGNILIYNAPGISTARHEIQEFAQPDRLLINHWHEAMFGAPELDVPVFVHEADRAQTDLPIAGTFRKREKIGDDLDVIPTPGHTAGTTMFLWDNGEHRVLFSGDSLWVRRGEWKAVLLEESDRDAYLASLSLLMELEFDYLVPWGSDDGQPYGYAVTHGQARDNLDRISQRLRAGESG